MTNEKRWRERVRDAVNEQLPELDRCFALHEGEARGTLVWVQVNGSGEVAAVDVPRETPDGLARCIDGGVRRWHIEVGDAPGADLSFSFVLEECDGARDCLRAWERRSDGP